MISTMGIIVILVAVCTLFVFILAVRELKRNRNSWKQTNPWDFRETPMKTRGRGKQPKVAPSSRKFR
mgnify:FL=1